VQFAQPLDSLEWPVQVPTPALPAAQLSQSVCAVPAWYLPLGQFAQSAEEDEPLVEPNVPVVHE
jgi:hypothetical protein